MFQQHNSASVRFPARAHAHGTKPELGPVEEKRAAGSPVEKGRKYLAGGKRPNVRQRSKDYFPLPSQPSTPSLSLFSSSSSLLANHVVKYSTTKRSTTLLTTRVSLDKHVRSSSCVIKHQRRRQSRRHRRQRWSTAATIDSLAKFHQPLKIHRKRDAYLMNGMQRKKLVCWKHVEKDRTVKRHLLILLGSIIPLSPNKNKRTIILNM